MAQAKSKRETKYPRVLQDYLVTGETLLAGIKGKSESFGDNSYYVGLTDRRMMFVPLEDGKDSGELIWINRRNVKSINSASALTRLLYGNWLRVVFLGDVVRMIVTGQHWNRAAREMVSGMKDNAQAPNAGVVGADEDGLQQVRAFMALDLNASAQKMLDDVLAYERDYSLDSSVTEIIEELTEIRFARQVTSVILLVSMVLRFGWPSALWGTATGTGDVLGLIQAPILTFVVMLNVWLVRLLWRAREKARQWLRWWGGLSIVFAVINFSDTGSLLVLISEVAYGVSLLLLSLEASSRTRTIAASSIYVVGFLGGWAVATFGATATFR